LLTLSGPGGVGKTRLALQAAAQLLADFKDGVYFIDLSPITSEELIPSRIAQALNIKVGPGRSPTDQLVDFLDNKNCLIILDNFEQVISAANWISQLLSRLPSLSVMITSRRLLNIYGEYEFEVPTLSLPPTEPTSTDALTNVDSVRLFVQRARAANSQFSLNDENAWVVSQICSQLDGLPLAIELAAARIRLYSPEFLLSQLNDALSILTGGPRDTSERHQTLRAAIDWSYQLLDDDLKKVFVRSAVFQGGQTVEATEAICLSGLNINALDSLADLFDHSLLRRREDLSGQPRFEMLETIHQYGLEKLAASSESDELNRRHAEYFTKFAEQGGLELRGPRQ
jgi:predicted ATPase